MKTSFKTALAVMCSVSLMCGCASNGQNSRGAQYELNKRAAFAYSWMENSAEYRALCYQTYNAAYARIKDSLKDKSSKPRAIILDLDETVINNIPAEATVNAFIKDSKDFGKNWDLWESLGRAEAMPGATEFLQKVDKLGVNIFYVSNRSCKNLEATQKNLKNLKFPLKNEVKCKDNSSNKKLRFEKIANEYNVVAYLGDNANDFPINLYGVYSTERSKSVDKNSSLFGVKYFVLPNPVYGDWYHQMQPNFFRNSSEKMVEYVDASVKQDKKLKEEMLK